MNEAEGPEQEQELEKPPVTKGVRIARQNRSECNQLTDEQRDALLKEGMAMIYGSQQKVTPSRS